MSDRGNTKRFRHDPFKGIDYLKENSRAYQAYTNALRSAQSWASRGMAGWSAAWESYAQAIAKAGPKWTLIKRPSCVHPPKSYDAEGRVRVGRKSHRRNSYYSGISISGGMETREVQQRTTRKQEEARERARAQEIRLMTQVKKNKENLKKSKGVRA